ncbi:MAG TPA: sigma-E processing peptidase SpoIIGA [Bacilli bacterium]
MVVYLDLIFLVNFLLDATILGTTAWSRKLRPSWWRVAAAACIGASYVLMMFFPAFNFMFTFLVKCIFSLVMIYIAFGFGSLQHFLRNLGHFYFINFVAAGGILAAHYVFQSSGEVMNGLFYTQSGGMTFGIKIGLLFILVVFAGSVFFYKRVVSSSRQREALTQYFAEVQIFIGDYESNCRGLIDTGNQMYDPLTRIPVMVLEASKWKDVLPASWMKQIQQLEAEQIAVTMENEDFIWQDRLRWVPYKGVGKGTQFMLALKPDKVVITQDGIAHETHKVLIGLTNGKLSSDGSYEAIIHPLLAK